MTSKQLTIYTIVSTKIELLELQLKCFNRFIKNSFELIVIDNSNNTDLNLKFKNFCEDNNLSYIAISTNDNRGPGFRHAQALNILWQNYAINSNSEYVMVCDSDIFCVKDTIIEELLEHKYLIAAPLQHRQNKYFWVGPTVAIFNKSKILNLQELKWDAGTHVNGVALDTGGESYYFLDKNPEVKALTKNLKATHHLNKSRNNINCLPDKYANTYEENFFLEFFSNNFLHYARGSNWDNASNEYHQKKLSFVNNLLDDLISGNVIAKTHNFLIENEYYGKWQYSD